MLPVRPNGSTGWIAGRDLSLERSDYLLAIDLSQFRLDVFRLCDLVATCRIGCGTKEWLLPLGTLVTIH